MDERVCRVCGTDRACLERSWVEEDVDLRARLDAAVQRMAGGVEAARVVVDGANRLGAAQVERRRGRMSDRPITTCPSLRWERADHRRGERPRLHPGLPRAGLLATPLRALRHQRLMERQRWWYFVCCRFCGRWVDIGWHLPGQPCRDGLREARP